MIIGIVFPYALWVDVWPSFFALWQEPALDLPAPAVEARVVSRMHHALDTEVVAIIATYPRC
jgi:hypothetical protein